MLPASEKEVLKIFGQRPELLDPAELHSQRKRNLIVLWLPAKKRHLAETYLSSSVLGRGIEPGRFGSSLWRRTPFHKQALVGADGQTNPEFAILERVTGHSLALPFFHPLSRAGK